MAENLVQIEMLGTRFFIQTDQEPEYIQGLLQNLKKRVLEIQEKIGLKDPVKVAILVALFLEDTLAKHKVEGFNREDHEEVEQLRLNMIKSIERVLAD